MSKKKKKAEGILLSQTAWAILTVCRDAGDPEKAEDTLREHAQVALEAGRSGVIRDMLDACEEFLCAARAECCTASPSDAGTAATLRTAARTARRAAHLVGLQHPEENDKRLLKVLNGGLD